MNRLVTVHIKKIDHNHNLINELQNIVNQDFKFIFEAVIVHGSVATNEIVAYSDFDGMLIIKDEFWGTKVLKDFLKKSMRVIHQFDPLQHHGWFQLKASELNNYSEVKNLPLAVLKEARMIFPFKDQEFLFKIKQDEDYNKPALRMINSIESKLSKGTYGQNLFYLKSFLSELMLLPSLVYQAQYKQGIFKKRSFDEMKSDYSSNSWQAIAVSSEIREIWTNEFKASIKLFVYFKDNRFLKRVVRKYLAPEISPVILCKLNKSFLESVKSFLVESKALLEEKKT